MIDSQFPAEVLDRLQRAGVVAVLILDRAEDAVPLARALIEGGVTAMELTLRTPAARDGLRAIRGEVPEMLAGVGTVLTPEQVWQVADADAAFAVSPGLNRAVIEEAQSRNLPFAPGVVTPSEVEAALELGCRELKFFPAEPSGGLEYLKSMAAPYAHLGVRFVPLGGVNTENTPRYLADPSILAVGGTWIAPRQAIAERDWEGIARRAAEVHQIVQQVRLGDA
ncbi:MAG: bifunctional 4-hydroxy-2-oxoglutarate aldolase/2-dehydro-3-deoxy-phosphogluconate aldolase [Pirellulales bacterium]